MNRDFLVLFLITLCVFCSSMHEKNNKEASTSKVIGQIDFSNVQFTDSFLVATSEKSCRYNVTSFRYITNK